MPIRFKTDGTVEVDTLEEAVAWQSRLAKKPEPVAAELRTSDGKTGGEPRAARSHKRTPPPTQQRDLAAYLKALSPKGVAVMRALAKSYPSWQPSDELATNAGMGPTQLGPVFRSIYVQLENHGFERGEMVDVMDQPSEDGRHKRMSYRLDSDIVEPLRKAMKDVKESV